MPAPRPRKASSAAKPVQSDLPKKIRRPLSVAEVASRSPEGGGDYRTLFEISPASIMLLDERGTVLDVNPAFCSIFGYSRDEVVGFSIDRIALSDSSAQIKDHIRRILNGENLRHVVKNARRSGEECFLDLNETRIRFPDGTHGVLIVAADVTEQRRGEDILQRHSLVYNAMQEAVFVFDRAGLIVDVNPAAEKILGRSREDLVGRPAPYLNPPGRGEKISAEIIRTLRAKKVWRGEVPLLTASGEIRTASTIVSCLCDQAGERIGSVGINRDITVDKKLEAEMIKAQKLESLGVLAGGIAHDFNNLLMGILGNISLARLGSTDVSAVLAQAEKACLRAQDLTRQLLTFARGGAPVKKVVDLGPLLEETARFALRGSAATCEFSLPPDLWPVSADSGQISQVAHNLLLNAVQAMPQAGVVRVQAENRVVTARSADPLLAPGRYARVSVSDPGVGIPAEILGSVFDPFFSTKPRGTGLGLAVCYSIIKNHGGRLTVESRPGRGSTFSFFLPASPEASVPEEPWLPFPVSGRGRILLIDDEELVAVAVGRMLERLGYSSEWAHDGREGVEIYAREREAGRPFDAAIVDLTIPGGMGGREAIVALRKLDPDIKAVVSSGYSNDPILADYGKYGFRAALAKPFTIHVLGRVMGNVLGEKRK